MVPHGVSYDFSSGAGPRVVPGTSAGELRPDPNGLDPVLYTGHAITLMTFWRRRVASTTSSPVGLRISQGIWRTDLPAP